MGSQYLDAMPNIAKTIHGTLLRLRWAFQRFYRGYDDRAIDDLSSTVAVLVADVLENKSKHDIRSPRKWSRDDAKTRLTEVDEDLDPLDSWRADLGKAVIVLREWSRRDDREAMDTELYDEKIASRRRRELDREADKTFNWLKTMLPEMSETAYERDYGAKR